VRNQVVNSSREVLYTAFAQARELLQREIKTILEEHETMSLLLKEAQEDKLKLEVKLAE
jgi:cellobiose-specific phosphotransferase system component IIA